METVGSHMETFRNDMETARNSYEVRNKLHHHRKKAEEGEGVYQSHPTVMQSEGDLTLS